MRANKYKMFACQGMAGPAPIAADGLGREVSSKVSALFSFFFLFYFFSGGLSERGEVNDDPQAGPTTFGFFSGQTGRQVPFPERRRD